MSTVLQRRKNAKPVSAADKDPSLVEAVYHALLSGILEGHYPPDSVLSEVAVARELEVSRTPVHDALRQLARDGVVVRERNRRARVAGITPDDVFEVFEMRKSWKAPRPNWPPGEWISGIWHRCGPRPMR